ncbi:hypothetical protein PPERSA_01420 [Pseudocohnilembus persalinus]|uniref:Uncharacterized protein n=1 Tax=Pseudocohnilembus persalinus TaxID=266149 RepID=A0A0V0QH09_PSEPJ|nr:hypothetical protein PPERSA_01420 [Pseudocohnilembus persalinus]|eukprot:KRX01517.1 hypothetical protein PPERSA_01420 [Pseudocohnilembus persalinus]
MGCQNTKTRKLQQIDIQTSLYPSLKNNLQYGSFSKIKQKQQQKTKKSSPFLETSCFSFQDSQTNTNAHAQNSNQEQTHINNFQLEKVTSIEKNLPKNPKTQSNSYIQDSQNNRINEKQFQHQIKLEPSDPFSMTNNIVSSPKFNSIKSQSESDNDEKNDSFSFRHNLRNKNKIQSFISLSSPSDSQSYKDLQVSNVKVVFTNKQISEEENQSPKKPKQKNIFSLPKQQSSPLQKTSNISLSSNKKLNNNFDENNQKFQNCIQSQKKGKKIVFYMNPKLQQEIRNNVSTLSDILDPTLARQISTIDSFQAIQELYQTEQHNQYLQIYNNQYQNLAYNDRQQQLNNSKLNNYQSLQQQQKNLTTPQLKLIQKLHKQKRDSMIERKQNLKMKQFQFNKTIKCSTILQRRYNQKIKEKLSQITNNNICNNQNCNYLEKCSLQTSNSQEYNFENNDIME